MAVEFRGVRNLVYAPITADTDSAYTTGEVKTLAPVAEISKTVETSSEAHYYDNKPAIVINSEGADTVTLTIAVPDPETYAELTGRAYDSATKRVLESGIEQRYFAIGYILGEIGEGDDERWVWRLKGTFSIPEETSATKNDGTDANNLSLEFTGIYTTHEFTNGAGTGVKAASKALFVRQKDVSYTADDFFEAVVTPDSADPT